MEKIGLNSESQASVEEVLNLGDELLNFALRAAGAAADSAASSAAGSAAGSAADCRGEKKADAARRRRATDILRRAKLESAALKEFVNQFAVVASDIVGNLRYDRRAFRAVLERGFANMVLHKTKEAAAQRQLPYLLHMAKEHDGFDEGRLKLLRKSFADQFASTEKLLVAAAEEADERRAAARRERAALARRLLAEAAATGRLGAPTAEELAAERDRATLRSETAPLRDLVGQGAPPRQDL